MPLHRVSSSNLRPLPSAPRQTEPTTQGAREALRGLKLMVRSSEETEAKSGLKGFVDFALSRKGAAAALTGISLLGGAVTHVAQNPALRQSAQDLFERTAGPASSWVKEQTQSALDRIGQSPLATLLGQRTGKDATVEVVKAAPGTPGALLDAIETGRLTLEVPLREGTHKIKGVRVRVEPGTVLTVQVDVQDGKLVPRVGDDGTWAKLNHPLDGPLFFTTDGVHVADAGEGLGELRLRIGTDWFNLFDVGIGGDQSLQLSHLVGRFAPGLANAPLPGAPLLSAPSSSSSASSSSASFASSSSASSSSASASSASSSSASASSSSSSSASASSSSSSATASSSSSSGAGAVQGSPAASLRGATQSLTPSAPATRAARESETAELRFEDLIDVDAVRFRVDDLTFTDGVLPASGLAIRQTSGGLSLSGDARSVTVTGDIGFESLALAHDAGGVRFGAGRANVSVTARMDGDESTVTTRVKGLEAAIEEITLSGEQASGGLKLDGGLVRAGDLRVDVMSRAGGTPRVSAHADLQVEGRILPSELTLADLDGGATLSTKSGTLAGEVRIRGQDVSVDATLSGADVSLTSLQQRQGTSEVDLEHAHVKGDGRLSIRPVMGASMSLTNAEVDVAIRDLRTSGGGMHADLGRTTVRGKGDFHWSAHGGVDVRGDLRVRGAIDDLRVRHDQTGSVLDLAPSSRLDGKLRRLTVGGEGFALEALTNVDLRLESSKLDAGPVSVEGGGRVVGLTELRIEQMRGRGSVRLDGDARIDLSVKDGRVRRGADLDADLGDGTRMVAHLRSLELGDKLSVTLGKGSRLDAVLDGGHIRVGDREVPFSAGTSASFEVDRLHVGKDGQPEMLGRLSVDVPFDAKLFEGIPGVSLLPATEGKARLTVGGVRMGRDGSFSLEQLGLSLTAQAGTVTGATRAPSPTPGPVDGVVPGVLEQGAVERMSAAEIADVRASEGVAFHPLSVARRLQSGTLELSVPMEGRLKRGAVGVRFEEGTELLLRIKVENGRIVPNALEARLSKPADGPLWITVKGVRMNDKGTLKLDLGGFFDIPLPGMKNMPTDVDGFISRLESLTGGPGAGSASSTSSATNASRTATPSVRSASSASGPSSAPSPSSSRGASPGSSSSLASGSVSTPATRTATPSGGSTSAPSVSSASSARANATASRTTTTAEPQTKEEAEAAALFRMADASFRIDGATLSPGPLELPGGTVVVESGTRVSLSGDLRAGEAEMSLAFSSLSLDRGAVAVRGGAGRATVRTSYETDGNVLRSRADISDLRFDVESAAFKGVDGDYLHLESGRAAGRAVLSQEILLNDAGAPVGLHGEPAVDLLELDVGGTVRGARMSSRDAGRGRVELGETTLLGEVRVVDSKLERVAGTVKSLDAALHDIEIATPAGRVDVTRARVSGDGYIELSPDRMAVLDGSLTADVLVDPSALGTLKLGGASVDLSGTEIGLRLDLSRLSRLEYRSGKDVPAGERLRLDAELGLGASVTRVSGTLPR